MRQVLEEFPSAAAVLHEALAVELLNLTDSLERVRGRFFASNEAETLPAPDQAFPIGNTLARG